MRQTLSTKNSKPIALISGASDGLGREIAYALAESGYQLAICGRNEEKLHKTALICREKSANVFYRAFDLAHVKELESFVSATVNELGPIDCLVNNAGLGYFGSLMDLSTQHISEIFDVNLKAAIFLSKFVLHSKKENFNDSILIVNISSAITRFKKRSHKIPYAISKTALNAFSEALTEEYLDTPLKVLNVILGPTFTCFDRNTPTAERIRILGNANIHRTPAELDPLMLSSEETMQFYRFLGDWFLNPIDVAQKIKLHINEINSAPYREIEIRPKNV